MEQGTRHYRIQATKDKVHIAAPVVPGKSKARAETQSSGLFRYPILARCWEVLSYHRVGRYRGERLRKAFAGAASEI